MTLFGKNNFKRASILIELLISMFIVAAIFPAALSLLKQTADNILSLYDKRVAMQRIASAESLLDYPLYYCGYAMPLDSFNYQRAFNHQTQEPFCWDGPISVDMRNSKNNALLKIAYGKREKIVVATNLHYDSSNRTLSLNKKCPTDNIKASSSDFPSNVQNYLLFSSLSTAPVPLSVKQISGTSLLLGKTVNDNFMIFMNDPVFLFCAMKLYAENNILYSKDFRTSGVQPRVKGVVDMRFFPDLEHRYITVYTLVMGDVKFKSRHNNTPLKLTNFRKDVNNTQLMNEWESISSQYKLYASKKLWRLPNCINQANYLPKNMD